MKGVSEIMACKSPNGSNLNVFLTPGFLGGLGLLLLNDCFLKATFHNWLTGKMSDFAGLFVFSLFWSALLPRLNRFVPFATGVLFVFWKSPHSRPLLDAWNRLPCLPIGRTVDPSDLLALIVLPLAFLYGEARRGPVSDRRFAPYLVACVSVFAFTATSLREVDHTFDYSFVFREPKSRVLNKIRHFSHLNSADFTTFCKGSAAGATEFDFHMGRSDKREFYYPLKGVFELRESPNGCTLTLKKVSDTSAPDDPTRGRLISVFEKQFVGKIRRVEVPEPADASIPPSFPKRKNPKGQGPVRLVLCGDVPDVRAAELTVYFQKHLNIRVQVSRLPVLTDDLRTDKSSCARFDASKVAERIKSTYPEALSGLVVGLVEDAWSSRTEHGGLLHVAEDGVVLVAVKRLDPSDDCDDPNPELFNRRLRKIIAGIVGRTYFKLPENDDPKSLLHPISCVHELDAETERF